MSRDDFTQSVKDALAGRVGYVCSNPNCRQPTSGPSESAKPVTNVGVAAHITAASPGGPRYDDSLGAAQRSGLENGIWLCQRCQKAVDDDPVTYTVGLLRQWRAEAEVAARGSIESGPHRPVAQTVQAAVYLGTNAVNISGHNAVALGPNAIQITGPVVSAPQQMPPPDPDGLYRLQGRPVCPECLRTKGVAYPLEQQSTGGSAYADGPFGEFTYIEGEPTNKWECSVCKAVFTQSE